MPASLTGELTPTVLIPADVIKKDLKTELGTVELGQGGACVIG
jgi:hypothetical protein